MGAAIYPACYSPSPARRVSVDAIYEPYQWRSIVAVQQGVDDPQTVPVRTALGLLAVGGWRLFTMDPISTATWMQIDVRPLATLVYSGSERPEPPSEGEIAGGRQGYTPARARVGWYEAGSVLHSIDLDIGAGLNIALPPTHQVEMDLLVPNPEGTDAIPVPDDYAPIRGTLRFGTTVRAKATCIAAPATGRGREATISQLVYVDGTPALLAGQQIPVPRGARYLQGYVGAAAGNTVAPTVSDTLIRFVQEWGATPPGQIPGPPVSLMPDIPVALASPTLSYRVPVPAGYPSVRVSVEPGASRRRNVTLVWGLDI